jgi:hypothetical protein
MQSVGDDVDSIITRFPLIDTTKLELEIYTEGNLSSFNFSESEDYLAIVMLPVDYI